MWLLQLKNIRKRHLLWAKLAAICLFFHGIFLVWIFVIYHDTALMLSLTVHKKIDYSLPIMFTALQQPIATKNNIVHQSSIKQSISNTQKPHTKIEHNNKTTLTEQVKNVSPQKESAQAIAHPISIQKSETEEKKISSASNEIKKNKIDELPLTKGQKEPIHQNQKTYNQPSFTTSNNHREVQALRCTAQLQQELVRHWHPPIGTPAGCSCELSFFVNNKGIIDNVKMVKNSGVTMFDISARQALLTMKMPHWTYGKSLVITFE